jgi:hypothetical protein
VGYELVKLDGTPSGVAGELVIASNGQTVLFVGQFPGASDLQLPFRGVLRLSSATPIAALAIRGRYNERGEFLLSTTPPVDPESVPEEDTFIPQLVDGAGYSTEIVIHDLVGNGGVSGDIYFFDQDGQPIVPDLRQSSVLPVR